MIVNKCLLNKCIQDKIPIVRDKTAQYILDTINKYQSCKILEIGTAYGYSTFLWANHANVKLITSIEKNENNYLVAKQFVNLPNVELICNDAFIYQPNQLYDLIFVDGPKSHQEILITKYLNYLKPKGKMIVDNLFLSKFAKLSINELSKNQLKLLNKLSSLRTWLQNQDFHFELLEIDDGVGIITKYAK